MRAFVKVILLSSLLLANALFSQTVLFSETFANGNLENIWYAGFSGNNMEVEFMSGNPSGDSWVGKLGNDLSGGNVGESFSGDPGWTDYYLEAQVYIPFNEGTYYGIEFRVDSVGLTSAYQFLARPGDAILRFRTRVGASPATIKDWTDADIPGGFPATNGWHKMAVRVIGNQFRFYFNDNELPGGPYTDNTFSTGWIGTYVWDFALSPIYLYIDDITVTTPVTDVEENHQGIIANYALYQNFPNPFNPSTNIEFDLISQEQVQLVIYNGLGQKIKNLVNDNFPAGNHQVEWNGRDDLNRVVAAGVYFYQIQAGSFQETKKMLLIK
jgi:hypothetical protein